MVKILLIFICLFVSYSGIAYSQTISDEQMRIYERACTTGLSVSIDVDAGLNVFRKNFIDGKGKLTRQEIATLLSKDGLQTDESKIKALIQIQDCYRQYIERFSLQNSEMPPINVQQAFLSVIAQIASFKRYASATVLQMPNEFEKGFDIINPKKDSKLVDISNYLRYAPFLDPSGSQIDLNRVRRDNFPVLCQNFNQEVEDFNSVTYFLYQNYNSSWGSRKYSIPDAIQEICRRK